MAGAAADAFAAAAVAAKVEGVPDVNLLGTGDTASTSAVTPLLMASPPPSVQVHHAPGSDEETPRYAFQSHSNF